MGEDPGFTSAETGHTITYIKSYDTTGAWMALLKKSEKENYND
jgi:hypothetical protein